MSLHPTLKWVKRLLCKHSEVTKKLTVSGYGYTEYQIWWCCDCEKTFIKQTKEQH
jgi:hypothetical protein